MFLTVDDLEHFRAIPSNWRNCFTNVGNCQKNVKKISYVAIDHMKRLAKVLSKNNILFVQNLDFSEIAEIFLANRYQIDGNCTKNVENWLLRANN